MKKIPTLPNQKNKEIPMSNIEPFIFDIAEAICNGTFKTAEIAGCKYIINPTTRCIADVQYILDTIARKKSKSEQCQVKVSTKEEKIPRGPDRIRQEFKGIVSCIDPLTVHDGFNGDTYERQILIRCVAAATTLLKMHFDDEIKRIEQKVDYVLSTHGSKKG